MNIVQVVSHIFRQAVALEPSEWVHLGPKVMAANLRRAKGFQTARPVLAALVLSLLVGSNAAVSATPQENAWSVLEAGLNEHSTSKRAAAVSALGLLRDDPRAIEFSERSLRDKKPAVRAAAATALGQMGATSSIPLLQEALADKKSRVYFAAADSLISFGDAAGDDLYYQILTGEKQSGEGRIASKKRLIRDPRTMALFAFGIGIGYAPYAGYGWTAWKELSKDYGPSVRVTALNKLANDQDSKISKALIHAASDKHWKVRAAALSAIARRGDPALLIGIVPQMNDRNATVRYTAAAAVLRLSALAPVNTLEGPRFSTPDSPHPVTEPGGMSISTNNPPPEITVPSPRP